METTNGIQGSYKLKQDLFRGIAAIIVVILCGLSYSYGVSTGKENAEVSAQDAAIKMQDEIAGRYLQHTFNPVTVEQQCAFEYTIYGECGED